MAFPFDKNGLLVWQKVTWGSFGQHDNLYTFVIDLETLEQKPIFKVLPTKHINDDSSKNYYRYTYIKREDLDSLDNVIIKIVRDYASSRKRRINVEYWLLKDGKSVELKAERNMRDEKGWFDLVHLPDGRKLRVSRDNVSFV